MNSQLQMHTVKLLNDTYDRLERGEISTIDVLSKGRLSIKKLGLKCTTNSLLSDPKCYPALRKLKLFAEHIELGSAQVAEKHVSLIESVAETARQHGVSTRTELSRVNLQLYRQVCESPDSSVIFRLAGLCQGRAEFLYWADNELIEAAGKFVSLSDLKKRGGELHRHIKGRGLESDVLQAHPTYATGFYIGFSGACYRSIPELIMGNLLTVNQIEHVYEMQYFPRGWEGTKPLRPDFFFPAKNAIVEVVLTDHSSRGSRRESYVWRNVQKAGLYHDDDKLQFRFINSEPFYKYYGFDIKGWVDAVTSGLNEMGIDIGPLPINLSGLRWENSETKEFFLSTEKQVVIDYLVNDLSVGGIGDFINHHSSINHLIKARRDGAEILRALKQFGADKKSEALRRHFQSRRDSYLPLEQVTQFAKQHNITSSKLWSQFSKGNKSLLKRNRIPANLRAVYMRRGEWTSWSAALRESPISGPT